MNEPPESNPVREAEAGSLQRSDFLAAMTHELRTPLNALIGMSRLLLGTALNREQEEYAQTMLLAADAMLGVTNNILDFSKIQAGRVTLEDIDFDLVDVIEDAIDLVAVKVWEKGLRLTYEIGDEVPRGLRGDPARLRQVLSNLLSNAVKFTDRGSVHVSVGAGDSRNDRIELRFDVKDSGIGIKPEGLERLFKAFSQADPTITRRFGGTGLGLAICERLVALMSGRISAESRYGHGSVFRFSVMVGRGSPVAAEVPALAGRGVLIVDADPAHLSLQARRCRSFGMKVAVAPSPHAVLECMAQGGVDVALVDDVVAGVRGAELARAITDCAGRVPVILMATGSPAGAE
ncbi:MAG TPA: ATP-binding protein, partial [Rhodocyclaceae bacterium]